jgi:hypothetical protein
MVIIRRFSTISVAPDAYVSIPSPSSLVLSNRGEGLTSELQIIQTFTACDGDPTVTRTSFNEEKYAMGARYGTDMVGMFHTKS